MNNIHSKYSQGIQFILQNIVEYLQQEGSLVLAILFGSQATETATVRSDIDILAVFKGLSANTSLFPPENTPIGADILAIPEKNFSNGLNAGKGLFIEAMVRGRILFGEPQTIQKYQAQARKIIELLRMVRTDIGWKRNAR